MITMENIAEWLDEAKASAKRGITTAKNAEFRALWEKRAKEIEAAQNMLKGAMATLPLEEFIKKEKAGR